MKHLIESLRIGRTVAASLLAGLAVSAAHAQILFSAGSPYTQNFDTALATAGLWTDNSTIPGWYASKTLPAPGGPVTAFQLGSGTSTSGQLYSFGVAGVNPATDRAIGSIGSGTPGNFAYGVRFTNDTALTITNIVIAYTGEQWRNGGNASQATQPLAFSYLKSSTAITSSDAVNSQAWTSFSPLTFISPNTLSTTGVALDGNDPTNRVTFNVTLTNVTVGPGEEIFFRWYDLNDVGNDHGLAVDDLSISYSTIAANNNPPTISQQPVGATNYAGNNVLFSVTANGKSPLAYQWYYTNAGVTTLIDGAVNASFALNTITNGNAGQYFVIITNDVPGAITSSVVTLNVLGPVVTNIAYIHTLQDANYVSTNTTTLFQLEGVVTTPANLVSGGVVYSFYIQDSTGGIDIFHRGGFDPNNLPTLGQRVRVTAKLDQFLGNIEVAPVAANPASLIEVLNGGATEPLPAPKVFDFASQGIFALMETNYEGSLVVVSNVYLDQTLGTFTAGGSTVLMTNALGVTFPLVNPSPVTDPQGQFIPGFAYSITGVLTQNKSAAPFTGSYQLNLSTYADIVTTAPVGPPTLNIQAAGGSLTLSWTGTSVLQSSTNVAGPYLEVPGATSPFVTNGAASSVPAQFFRLYQAP